MNSIGFAAVATVLIAWLGALVSGVALMREIWDRASFLSSDWRTAIRVSRFVWSDAKARRRFVIFLACGALGVLSALAAFVFGDWAMTSGSIGD